MKLETVMTTVAPPEITNAMGLVDKAIWPDGIVRKIIPEGDYRRKEFIGSSNVAAIMKLSPTIGGDTYTPYEVYLAKTGDGEEELTPQLKLFLERRKRLEPYAFQMLKEEFKADLFAYNVRYIDPSNPVFCAEIDSEAMVDGEAVNVEVKTVSARAFGEKFGWGEPGTDQVPIHYYLQVQFGLMVTGRRRAFVAALVGFDQMEFFPIDRVDLDVAEIRAACTAFWKDHVLAGVAPEPQTLRDLAKRFKEPVAGLIVNASDDIGSKALQLRALMAQRDALEMQAQSLEFDVKNAMRDAEELWVGGDKVIKWPSQRWSRLDQDSLKTKEPKTHKLYTISGTHRVFQALKGWKPSI